MNTFMVIIALKYKLKPAQAQLTDLRNPFLV